MTGPKECPLCGGEMLPTVVCFAPRRARGGRRALPAKTVSVPRCPVCVGAVRWVIPRLSVRVRFRDRGGWSEDDPGLENAVRALEG